jgi:sugar/nucleoside kinase (ribokinase family)
MMKCVAWFSEDECARAATTAKKARSNVAFDGGYSCMIEKELWNNFLQS